jgi:chemotaxis protein MotD
MAGGATAVRGTSTEPTFQSYTDGLSPGSQIARSVTAEIADTDQTTSNKDGVLKVLHIELKPQNLGSVSVRMSLKDDVISLHMEASRHETTAAIEKERSALTSALKSAGYVVDEITTQTADPTRASGRIEAATNDASMSSFAQGESQGRSQTQQDSSSGRGQNGQRGAGGDVSLTSSNGMGESADGMSRQRTSGIYV